MKIDNYIIRKSSRAKSVRLRVLPDGEVVVTAPKRAPKYMIDKFVSESWHWIERQKRKNNLRQQVYPVFSWEERLVRYLGKLYFIQVNTESKRDKVELIGDKLIVTPITGLKTDARSTLLKWLKRQAAQYFEDNVPTWSQKMDVEYSTIAYRQQASRWGSCSSKGTLSFNWRLIHYEKAVIDYVIVHELAHVLQMNHSRDFWDLVARYKADYKKHVNFLKSQVLTLEKL